MNGRRPDVRGATSASDASTPEGHPAFEAAPWCRNPHLQTIVGRIARRRFEPRYDRVRLDTDDGDFLDVDIAPEPEDVAGVCLLLHGLEGSARSGYMVSTGAALAAAGVRAVALNFRTCGGEPNRLPRAYHSGETSDIARVLAWMSRRFAGLPRAAVGFSLGGSALLNLLGRDSENDRSTGERASGGAASPGTGAGHLSAAVAVSVPYDLAAAADALERGVNRLYSARFLRSLRAKAREKAARFPDRIAPGAASVRSLREFDDRMTAPLHGFRDAADYYERCSSAPVIGSVSIPALLVHARDDPVAPIASMPLDDIRRRTNLSSLLTERGGHLGFLDRRLGAGTQGWLERVVAGYVAAALSAAPSPASQADNAPEARVVF